MNDTDFNIDELLDYEKKLMKRINTDMPQESTKVLDKSSSQLRERLEEKTSLSDKKKPKIRHLKYRWRKDKVRLKRGTIRTKVYNSLPHAHLYESGHIAENGVFVKGSHLFEQELEATEKEIINESRKLIDKVFGD